MSIENISETNIELKRTLEVEKCVHLSYSERHSETIRDIEMIF